MTYFPWSLELHYKRFLLYIVVSRSIEFRTKKVNKFNLELFYHNVIIFLLIRYFIENKIGK